MEIQRSGSSAFHGISRIDLADAKVSWDPNNQDIVIRASRVRDFSTPSHHDYRVRLSLPELAEILDTVGEVTGEEDTTTISKAISGSLRALIRLTFTCVGLSPLIESTSVNRSQSQAA